MKTRFVVAATISAVGVLAGSAGAEVVAPTVVKPQVVTPQVVSPAAAPASPAPVGSPPPAVTRPSTAAAPPASAPPADAQADTVGEAPAPSPTVDRPPAQKGGDAGSSSPAGDSNYKHRMPLGEWCIGSASACQEVSDLERGYLYQLFVLGSSMSDAWLAPVEDFLAQFTPDTSRAPAASNQTSAEEDCQCSLQGTSGGYQTGPASIGGAAGEVGDTFGELSGAAGRLLDKLLLLAN